MAPVFALYLTHGMVQRRLQSKRRPRNGEEEQPGVTIMMGGVCVCVCGVCLSRWCTRRWTAT